MSRVLRIRFIIRLNLRFCAFVSEEFFGTQNTNNFINGSIWPIDWALTFTTTLGWVELRIMAMKGYSMRPMNIKWIKIKLFFIYWIDGLINGTLIRLGLFYSEKIGNRIHIYIFFFFCKYLEDFLYMVIWC